MSLYKKIANIQDQILNIPKDGKNSHFSNTYATYEQVMEVLHPLLRKEGIMICHSFDAPLWEGEIAVVTTIADIEAMPGERDNFTTTLHIPITKQDPQMAGSAITYAKRYSVLAMLGLGTEDDDGEKASKPAPKTNVAPTPKPVENGVLCPIHNVPTNKFGGHELAPGKWCGEAQKGLK